MRLGLVFAMTAVLSPAAVSVDGNRFNFTGLDGGACLEFTSSTSFRLTRWWGPSPPLLGQPVYKDRVWTKSDDRLTLLAIDTKYLRMEIAKDDYRLSVKLPSGRSVWTERRGVIREGSKLVYDANVAADEKLYGFDAPVRRGSLDQHGQKFTANGPFFFFSSGGYGRSFSKAGKYDVDAGATDVNRLKIAGDGVAIADQFFFYGPTPKEIIEQYQTANERQINQPDEILNLSDGEKSLPRGAVKIPVTEANYCDLSLLVNQASLSGATYEAIDLSALGKYMDEAKFYPILWRSDPAKGGSEIELRRKPWIPYHRTYLREAYDRGLPFLRPLVLQFARDPGMERRSDAFMIGDELLVAPGCDVKTVELPRGRWTDLRTNKEYPGRTTATNDAPGMPVYAKMGSILPLVSSRKDFGLELHYYPNIGAEFFLIEPEVGEYSQFHAAPVGDILRVESESKMNRGLEWILHHVDKPRQVSESEPAVKYAETQSRGELKPGLFFYDAPQRNLHVMLYTKAGEDRIVNMTY
jgi:hypothetical protein